MICAICGKPVLSSMRIDPLSWSASSTNTMITWSNVSFTYTNSTSTNEVTYCLGHFAGHTTLIMPLPEPELQVDEVLQEVDEILREARGG